MYAIGSIPRRAEGQFFNTAFVLNPHGQLQDTYDKLHLFDIDIPGKITYKESETFTQGSKACVLDTEFCRFGLAICYDLRFAELGLLMRQRGASVLLYPGSFNQTTGPAHWELLLRARALDNQCFSVGVSVAQFKEDPTIYQSWAHSTVVDPFGRVLVALDENPAIAYCDIDPTYAAEVREQIPISKQKRHDVYKLEEV